MISWQSMQLLLVYVVLLAGFSKGSNLPFNLDLQNLQENSSERCASDTNLYLKNLKQMKSWALQMYDASAKLPSGILWGNTYSLGNYDECLKVDQGLVKGRYCLARISLKPANISNWPQERAPRVPALQNLGPDQNVWKFVQRSIVDPSKSRRDVLFWGICVPSTCESGHVERHVSRQLTEWAADLGLETDVEVTSCEDPTILSLSTPAIIYLAIVGCIVLMVISSTLYDLVKYVMNKRDATKASRCEQVLFCFSAYRNLKRLTSFKEDPNDGLLRCSHGVKHFTIALIVLGHRSMYAMSSPSINFVFIEEMYDRFESMLLLSGTLIVDTFLLLTGFLLCYLLISTYQRGVRVPLPVLYLNRYIRLTPALAVIVGFQALVLPLLGDGPIWHQKIDDHVNRCENYWWATLLYINNYVYPGDVCMSLSWYLSVDFQLFLISCPLIWLLWKRPRAGKIVLGLLLVLSVGVPIIVTAAMKLEPTLLVFSNIMSDPVKHPSTRFIYLPTHMRATPYIFGIICGYLKFLHKQNQLQLSKRVRWVCWIAFLPLPLVSMFSAWFFYAPGSVPSIWMDSLYSGLHRVGWALGLGWAVLAVTTSVSSSWGLLFGSRPVVALGRLTYSIYLVHTFIQLYSVATIRVPAYFSYFNLSVSTVADISLSIFFGALLSLTIESPLQALEKIILGNKIQAVEANASSKMRKSTQKTSRPLEQT